MSFLRASFAQRRSVPQPVTEREFRRLPANLAFSDSLHGLATGRWAFNPFNTYSNQTFLLTP